VPAEAFDPWRPSIPAGGSVLACDRGYVVGMAHYPKRWRQIRGANRRRTGDVHPTDAAADVRMALDVLGSLYLGGHRASAFAAANRLHASDSELVRRLDSAFASDVPAQLGFGF
jgi:Sterol carrier protein domain